MTAQGSRNLFLTLALCLAPVLSGAPSVGAQPPATQAPAKPAPTAKELIEQGKLLYRNGKMPQAQAKFDAALRAEPQNDEALGLGAITAFRLDNQTRARELFLRRATLPNQKESVRAYCDYWSGVSRWRQAHDLIAAAGEFKQGHVTYKLKPKDEMAAREHLDKGLEDVDRALKHRPDYHDAHNMRNLLLAESALIAPDETKAAEVRKQSLTALRQSFAVFQAASQKTTPATADFGNPTVRVGEFSENPDEDALLDDPMLLVVSGGRPDKRVPAILPNLPTPKPKDNAPPDSEAVTKGGGAFSMGHGRGALYGAQILTPGLVKIEVLIDQAGKVTLARYVGGKAEISGLAAEAARKWTFQPATFEGKPVQVSAIITFNVAKKGKATPTPTPAPRTN
ncbi:MAG: energy transducer TonB [Blastocatellia bacterium]